jgi:predicted nuclease of predicted toxin-antitoxin system
VNVKLLLDENLSPKVAETLCYVDGIDACHVRDRGILGAADHEVLERTFIEDRILVTSNVDDFLRLALARELHAGIVLIEQGDLRRDEQLALLRRVLGAIEVHGDMANQVLRVFPEGTMTFEEVPPGSKA